jgi:hypothetical protein
MDFRSIADWLTAPIFAYSKDPSPQFEPRDSTIILPGPTFLNQSPIDMRGDPSLAPAPTPDVNGWPSLMTVYTKNKNIFGQ